MMLATKSTILAIAYATFTFLGLPEPDRSAKYRAQRLKSANWMDTGCKQVRIQVIWLYLIGIPINKISLPNLQRFAELRTKSKLA